MRSIGVFVSLVFAAGACSPGVITDLSIGQADWKLVADSDRGLVDARHAEFGSYPNPKNVAWMDVSLRSDGKLCAYDGDKRWCGGPLQGIPYLSLLNVEDQGYRVTVRDMYGNTIHSELVAGQLPETLAREIENAAARDELASSPKGGVPQTAEAPAISDDVLLGARLTIDAINANLEAIGLQSRVAPADASKLTDFDHRGEISLDNGSCKDVLEYLDDEFSDDHQGTDDWVFGPEAMAQCLDDHECRIGQLVTRAMADACKALPASETRLYSAEQGIIGAGGAAVGELCQGENGEIEKCVGSPLVLDVAGDGLQLVGLDAGVTFPLFGADALKVGWLEGSDDALLAIDLDGDGAISRGQELFGESSTGWAPNGFAALARYDDNGDGQINAEDAVFERLLAWRDDGDGRSQANELLPLGALKIDSISLRHRSSDDKDDFGNQLGLVGSASATDGRAVPVIDVWFRVQRNR